VIRVEGDNAELRHYLARLVRRSRCFSRSLKALWLAVKVSVVNIQNKQVEGELILYFSLRNFILNVNL